MFERICSEQMPIEDELTLLKLTERLFDTSNKRKILEWLEVHNMNLEASVKFLQQLKLFQKFNTFEGSVYATVLLKTYLYTNIAIRIKKRNNN